MAANDRLYIAGSQGQTTGTGPTDKEPIGFEGSLLTSGTYLGLSRTTYPNWRANRIAVSAFLDESVLMRARTRITQEAGITAPAMAGRFKLACHPMQVDVLFKLAMPRLRYTGGNGADLGYSENPMFGNIKCVTSYLAPVDKAYLGDFSYSKPTALRGHLCVARRRPAGARLLAR